MLQRPNSNQKICRNSSNSFKTYNKSCEYSFCWNLGLIHWFRYWTIGEKKKNFSFYGEILNTKTNIHLLFYFIDRIFLLKKKKERSKTNSSLFCSSVKWDVEKERSNQEEKDFKNKDYLERLEKLKKWYSKHVQMNKMWFQTWLEV